MIRPPEPSGSGCLPAALIGVALILVAAAAAKLGGEAWELYSMHSFSTRGIVFGDPPEIPLANVYPLGVNVSLEAYRPQELERVVDLVKSDGVFRWVRQTFPWSAIEVGPGQFEWETWDRIVTRTTAAGLRVIAVLDTSPDWARASFDAGNPHAPPQEFEDYFRFVSALAARYGDRIDHYQIWDQPNIYPHWGERSVDPAAYENLLRGAYEAVHRSDPEAAVLTAGLAPNVELGGRNMSDLIFLQKMYDAGAASSFEVLSIKPYGFWWGPEDRTAEPGITNFSRAILVREVMIRNHDGGKPVWAAELGWNSLSADWAGAPPPWGSDEEVIQADRTVRALERALLEWPWMGVLVLERLDPALAEDDPRRGFALLEEDLSPRLTYRSIGSWVGDGLPLFPGRYGPEAWAVARRDGAQVVEFFGSRMELLGGSLQVRTSLDGRAEAVQAGAGRVRVAEGLADGRHRAEILIEEGEVEEILIARDGGFLVPLASLGVLGVAMAVLGMAGVRLASLDGSRGAARSLSMRFQSLPDPLQGGLVAAAALLLALSPWLSLDLIASAALLIGVALRPDWGLALVSFSLPFFLWGEGAVGRSSSLTEILLILTGAGGLARWVVLGGGPRSFRSLGEEMARRMGWNGGVVGWSWHRVALDLGVLGLVALGALSLLTAENLGVALREFRVVILEAALFYLLIRWQIHDEAGIWRLVDALVAGAAAVSVLGLAQWAAGENLIEADAVLRIRATYGSPNNLALYLGRIVPIALAVLWLKPPHRAAAYLLALVPVLAASLLTFSRGLWLLGLPASVLLLGAILGRRALARAAGAVAGLLLVVVLVLGGQRLASVADPQAETTARRIALWRASVEMIGDHPITGVGLDNFLYQYPRYVLPEGLAEPELSHPHNIVLHWWLSLGILGLPLLAGILLVFLRAGLRAFWGAEDPGTRAVALGFLGSMAYALAHGAIDQSFFLVDLAFVFMLTLAVIRQLEALVAPRQG